MMPATYHPGNGLRISESITTKVNCRKYCSKKQKLRRFIFIVYFVDL